MEQGQLVKEDYGNVLPIILGWMAEDMGALF